MKKHMKGKAWPAFTKQKALNDYQNGSTIRDIKEKYGFPSQSTIYHWIYKSRKIEHLRRSQETLLKKRTHYHWLLLSAVAIIIFLESIIIFLLFLDMG